MLDDLFSVEAIALKYEGGKAPTITATGEGAIASEIIRIAQEANVPLYENPELVALLGTLELGDEIPAALYHVVAEIIAFAYHLQGKTPQGFTPPSEGSCTNDNI
ncbi:MAG: flagellar protein FhlB [Alteromonadaceae bacterium]|nr:MAG: flagellar protein FhlB [Alteromonadaceae bacterium]